MWGSGKSLAMPGGLLAADSWNGTQPPRAVSSLVAWERDNKIFVPVRQCGAGVKRKGFRASGSGSSAQFCGLGQVGRPQFPPC